MADMDNFTWSSGSFLGLPPLSGSSGAYDQVSRRDTTQTVRSVGTCWGRKLNSSDRVYDRSQILRVTVQALIEQFEELERLRDRIRKAEARAIYARRYRGRLPRTASVSVQRNIPMR